MIQSLGIITGIAAGIAQMYGYWLYNKGIYTGKIKPNHASWFLWAFGNFIAYWSYSKLANDWAKEILPLSCAAVCIGTFIFAWVKGKFEWPDKLDMSFILLDLGVVAFWINTGLTTWTNLLMQIDVAITFIPLFRHVWKDPKHEHPEAWIVWSIAYLLLLITVCLRFEKWWDLMYPIVYFVLHFIVWLIARFRRP